MQRLQVAVINNGYYVTTVSDRPHLYYYLIQVNKINPLHIFIM